MLARSPLRVAVAFDLSMILENCPYEGHQKNLGESVIFGGLTAAAPSAPGCARGASGE